MFRAPLRPAPQAVPFALLALLLAAPAWASHKETPATLKGVSVVSAEKARELAAAGAMMVDTRVANEFAEGHISGAVSIVYKEKSSKATGFDASQDAFDVQKLPADKRAALIFYCNGAECWKSYKASVAALKAGHKAIHWLRGGFPEWKSKGFSVE